MLHRPTDVSYKLQFDRPRLNRLRKAYKAAAKAEAETFEFDGHKFYTPYAKYLIEYLEMKMGD